MQLSVASGHVEELPRLWAVKFHKIYLINLQSLTVSSVSLFIFHAPAPEQEDAAEEMLFTHSRLANFIMPNFSPVNCSWK